MRLSRYRWIAAAAGVAIALVLCVLATNRHREAAPDVVVGFDYIVQQVQAGILKPDGHGLVHLPNPVTGIDGNVIYTERMKDGRQAILFPRVYGRNSDIGGYLYVSAPLLPTDYVTSGTGEKWLHICGYSYCTVKPYHGNWYTLNRFVD